MARQNPSQRRGTPVLPETGKRVQKKTAADRSRAVSRTSDIPVDFIGLGIRGNNHDPKSGSGIGIK